MNIDSPDTNTITQSSMNIDSPDANTITQSSMHHPIHSSSSTISNVENVGTNDLPSITNDISNTRVADQDSNSDSGQVTTVTYDRDTLNAIVLTESLKGQAFTVEENEILKHTLSKFHDTNINWNDVLKYYIQDCKIQVHTSKRNDLVYSCTKQQLQERWKTIKSSSTGRSTANVKSTSSGGISKYCVASK